MKGFKKFSEEDWGYGTTNEDRALDKKQKSEKRSRRKKSFEDKHQNT